MELTGLPAIAPLEAQARNELLAALNGCVVREGVLAAAIVDAPPGGLAWFGCRGGAAFALDVLDGAPLRLDAADTGRAGAALDAAEPVLRAVETALGIELEPEALDAAAPGGNGWTVRLTVSPVTVLHLALPRDLSRDSGPVPVAVPFAPGLLHHVPLPVTLTLAGPRVAPVDAADLGPGDLVLLGQGPLAATLHIPGRARVAGQFDPAFRRFHPLTAVQESIR